MVGRGEIQLSTSNRNFAGKQGKGETYLVSPATAAASVIAGEIRSPLNSSADLIDFVPDEEFEDCPELSIISWLSENEGEDEKVRPRESAVSGAPSGTGDVIRGSVRLITTSGGELMDDIDTDMIFHNKYLSITSLEEMGKHTFETLEGYEDFAGSVDENDIIIAGGNFGCGSSRQQAVDCFISLGVGMVITRSTGAIYKRNIINSGFPFLEIPELTADSLEEGEELEINFSEGTLTRSNGDIITAEKPPAVQVDIYRAGGLFAYSGEEG
jgi:3-isopropylmalate dehydratase small subunit